MLNTEEQLVVFLSIPDVSIRRKGYLRNEGEHAGERGRYTTSLKCEMRAAE